MVTASTEADLIKYYFSIIYHTNAKFYAVQYMHIMKVIKLVTVELKTSYDSPFQQQKTNLHLDDGIL
jgi:hypothetical protein